MLTSVSGNCPSLVLSSVGFRHRQKVDETEDGHTGSRLPRRIVCPAGVPTTEDGASLVCVCRKSRPCLQSLHSPVDERRADAVSCVETANATTQRETGSCRGSPWGGCRESSHPCWSSPRPLLPRGPDSIADSGWAVGRLDRASTEQHPSQVLEARKSTERWCLGADETGGTGPFDRLPPRISTLRPRVQDSRERTAAIVPIHGIGQRSDQISHPAVDIVRVLLGCCSGPGQSLMPR